MKNNRKKIVLLLGAGFPMTWGAPSSKELLDKIVNDKKYMYNSDTTWGSFLYDILVSFYEGGEDANVNFETLLAALESILNYYFAITNEGKTTYNTSLTPAFFLIKDSIEEVLNEVDKREFCFDVYKHFVQLILNSIEEYNYRVLEHEEINFLFNKFIRNLMSKNYSVKIYTTNYDSIVPQILSNIKIYTGEQNLLQLGTIYRPDYMRNMESRLSYFNLHGSIYWDIKYNLETSYYEVVKSMMVEGVQPFLVEGGNPSEKLIFSPIIVGYTKTQRCMSFPFSIGFTNFINDCCDCNKILTIGYSFSDPHINDIIHNHINHRKVRLINIGLVDNNCNFDDTPEYLKIVGFVKSIYKEKEDSEWFYGINNEFLAYKKGTQSFLKNKNNWRYISQI